MGYRDQPTSIGCLNEHGKTETLTSSGWVGLPNHPLQICYHTLVGLEDKSMLLLGGEARLDRDPETLTGIWQLKNDAWKRIGEFSKPVGAGSAIYIGEYIYFFVSVGTNDYWNPYTSPIQRIEMTDDEEIKKIEVIGNFTEYLGYPVLFQTSSDFCV